MTDAEIAALADTPTSGSRKHLRVDFIEQCMREDTWPTLKGQRKRLRAKLARLWGMSEDTVKRHTSEASRRLWVCPDERESRREELANMLLKLATKAARERSTTTGLADIKAALEALDRYGRISGVDVDGKRDGGSDADKSVTVKILYPDMPDSDEPKLDNDAAVSTEPPAGADTPGDPTAPDAVPPVGPRRR